MKLCVSQGTFNPIHNAHLRVCEYAMQNFDFDKILIIPAYKPPHKNTGMPEHRLNMVQLAVKNLKKIEVSDIEYQRENKSYTYDTIKELYKRYNIDGRINFLIGTDAFKNIESWYRSDELKNMLNFIVFLREKPKEYEQDVKYFEKLKKSGYNYEIMQLPFVNVSSTQIRNNIKQGVPIHNLVPKPVEKYIEDHGLYRL